MVGVAGFEPAALWSQTRCATKLRHTPLGHHPSDGRGNNGVRKIMRVLLRVPIGVQFFQLVASGDDQGRQFQRRL